MRCSRTSVLGILVGLVAGVAHAAGTNMFVNPDLDADTSAWTFTGVASFSPSDDVNGCSESGAVSIDAKNVGGPYQAIAMQCVTVTDNSSGGASYWAKLVSGSGVTASFDLGPCASPGFYGGFGGQAISTDWAETNGSFGCCLGTGSVAVRLILTGSAPFTVLVDRAFFGDASAIFTDGFDDKSTCRWSAVAP